MFCVDPSQGCLKGTLHAEVIEPIALCHQIIGDIPEAFSAGKLADQHGDDNSSGCGIGISIPSDAVDPAWQIHTSGQVQAFA